MATQGASPFAKKEEVYGYQTFYRELGYYINRLEQYERALKFFNQAVSKTPDDKRALLGRAWARSKAIQYEGALEDIKRALKLDPDDLVTLYPKAMNTYLNGEFEEGLMQNNHLVKLRTKPDCFAMGVMHCTEAIENCIGDRAGHPLRDHFKIIRRLAWNKYYESLKPYEPKSKFKKKRKKKEKIIVYDSIFPPKYKKPKGESQTAIAGVPSSKTKMSSSKLKTEPAPNPDKSGEDFLDDVSSGIRNSLYSHKSELNYIPPPPSFPYRPLQNYTSNIKVYMAEKYLSNTYHDKLFLEKLMTEPGLKSPNCMGSKKILQAVKAGYKMVCYKQELLRTRRPFYFIKYQEAATAGAIQQRQEALTTKLRMTAMKEANQIKSKIHNALQNKQLRVVLELAEKLRNFCDSKPKSILPNREDHLNFLYSSVCQAHYDAKRLNPNQNEKQTKRRVLALFGIEISREPSRDSVIAQFKNVFLDWKKMIGTYEARIKDATTFEEMAWIYHELARFHYETKQYEHSRMYAKKCINEAIEINNPKWVINAAMLMTKCHIGQQNRNDAKVELNKAIEVAKEIKDQQLEKYLNKCAEVVETLEFDDFHGPKILERREAKIIELMQKPDMKAEARHLFGMMQAMPNDRRMFVMPGVKLADTGPKSKHQRQSIMPSLAKKLLEEEDMKKPPRLRQSKKKKTLGNSGAEFLNLIQFHVD